MKKHWVVVLLLLGIGVIYYIFGLLGWVPLYHCDTAMGPNGPVSFCEWYAGGPRIY